MDNLSRDVVLLGLIRNVSGLCATICYQFTARGCGDVGLVVSGGGGLIQTETGTTTLGDTVEDAISNLKEATAPYLEEFPHASVGHPLDTMFSLPEPANA